MIRNIVLAIILLAQISVWLVFDSPFKEAPPKSEPLLSKKLSDLDVANVTTIDYTDASGKQITLKKREGGWVIENLFGYPALVAKMEKLLQEFEGLSRSDFRSDKVSMHESFDVDAKKAQRIRFTLADGTAAGEYLIGKRDIQGSQGTFLREASSEEVYVVRSQEIGTMLSTDPYFWVNRRLFDIEITDQSALLETQNGCYRLEIEGRQQLRDPTTHIPVDPPQFTRVRFVYERVDGATPEAEPTWRVVEPEEKKDLVLGDLQVKTIVRNMLSLQVNSIVASAAKTEFGLDDPDNVDCRVLARFKVGESDVSRVIEIGSEFEAPSTGRPQGKQRYTRARHPGDKSTQSFVFGVPTTYPQIFIREPESLVKPPDPRPQVPPTTQPASSQPSDDGKR